MLFASTRADALKWRRWELCSEDLFLEWGVFVVVSHREPERVCRTSQSFAVRLWNRLRSVWSFQQREMGKQSLAICSHFRRSLRGGFVKSRLAQWNSALPYQRSFLSDAFSHLLVYCSVAQPSPPLHLPVYLLCAVLLILHCWLSFPLCVSSVLSARSIPWNPHSSCIIAGPGAGERWCYPTRCTGMSVFSAGVAGQRRKIFRLHINTLVPKERSPFFLFASHKAEQPARCHRSFVIGWESTRQSSE